MNKMLDKLMSKKSDKPLDPTYKSAKMSMLHELRNSMSGMMKDDLEGAKGMKKVEVASDSPEGLATGLETAKDMVSPDGEESESEEDPAYASEKMMALDELTKDCSPQEIDMLIESLEKKKMGMNETNEPKVGIL